MALVQRLRQEEEQANVPLTKRQEERYELYMTASLRSRIKKLIAPATGGSSVNAEAEIVIYSVTKLYVGELTEMSRIVMREWGDTGPIQPKHLREAYRRMRAQSTLGPKLTLRKL